MALVDGDRQPRGPTVKDAKAPAHYSGDPLRLITVGGDGTIDETVHARVTIVRRLWRHRTTTAAYVRASCRPSRTPWAGNRFDSEVLTFSERAGSGAADPAVSVVSTPQFTG